LIRSIIRDSTTRHKPRQASPRHAGRARMRYKQPQARRDGLDVARTERATTTPRRIAGSM
jgi:hypothetical protein